MMIEDLVSEHIYFENTRVGTDGTLWEHNGDMEVAIPRLLQEVDEMKEAITSGEPVERQLDELADVFIFLGTIGAHMCVREGIPISRIREAIQMKLGKNAEKYAEENFYGRTVKEGLLYSREKWKT